jgi:hypothetical protein
MPQLLPDGVGFASVEPVMVVVSAVWESHSP